MVDHKQTYQNDAERYDELIGYEDYQLNLLPAIQSITPIAGQRILDLGSGTGRLVTLLRSHTSKIIGLDISHAMLKVAMDKLEHAGCGNWAVASADHRNIPFEDQSFDLVISGWSICYLVDWNRITWTSELDNAFIEIRRVLKPGGMIVIIETQGTGFETPHPPEHLAEYFQYLNKAGFKFKWVRTDYQFPDLKTASNISQFFFGDDLAQQVKENKWKVLPECTGLWWKSTSRF